MHFLSEAKSFCCLDVYSQVPVSMPHMPLLFLCNAVGGSDTLAQHVSCRVYSESRQSMISICG